MPPFFSGCFGLPAVVGGTGEYGAQVGAALAAIGRARKQLKINNIAAAPWPVGKSVTTLRNVKANTSPAMGAGGVCVLKAKRRLVMPLLIVQSRK